MFYPANKKNTLTDMIIIAVIILISLIPFSAKPFHIDDTLFVYAAKHIQRDPLNFYGFDVNWYYTVTPMDEVMQNPPFASYYVAFIALLFGWSEQAIHVSLILPAIAMALGVYCLAMRFTSKPLLASLLTIFTPVFMVTGTSVMSDMLMLAFWCWAVIFWIKGLDENSRLLLMTGGLFIALSALTKYFGICLIPLLAAYSIIRKEKAHKWAPWMFVPAALLGGYQWMTHAIYGRGLLFDSASYALHVRYGEGVYYLENGFIGLVFTGGCIVTALFYYPALWSRRAVVIGLIFVFAATAVLSHINGIGGTQIAEGGRVQWDLIIAASLFALAGINIVWIAIEDVIKNHDAASALLAMWVIGVFIFASFINWTINARVVFPIAPAAGILFVRKFERSGGIPVKWFFGGRYVVPLMLSAVIALSAAWADYRHAKSARQAALDISEKYINATNRLWFQGHWGFQYYMEAQGAKAIDWARSMILNGDIIAVPLVNSALVNMPEDEFPTIAILKYTPSSRISVLSIKNGAGFYASVLGMIPYRFGPEFEDTYYVKRANVNRQMR